MDRASLLAGCQASERQFRLQLAIQHAPAWPVREESVEPFAWPFTAPERIAERKSVCEILALRATVEVVNIGNGAQNSMGVPVSFHEAFVSSTAERVRLMSRVHMHYDTHWKNNLVDMLLLEFPESAPGRFATDAHFNAAVARWAGGLTQYYTVAKAIIARHIETLLQMQVLCEELKPETRELVARCSTHEQLDRSMLTMGSVQESVSFEEGLAVKAPAPSWFIVPNAFR